LLRALGVHHGPVGVEPTAFLTARPRAVGATPQPSGVAALGLDRARDGVLVVPGGYAPERPAPLLVVLHGAGGTGRAAAAPLREVAEELGVLVLAPDSRGRTWDMILGWYGPDVAFLDGALADVFARLAVDPARVALAGFSDGASYALSLGLSNGDLFGDLIAFSPGFLAPVARNGAPRVFVSHGTQDPVLPIDHASRRLVPQLRAGGYAVRYVELEGGHAVPPEVLREAITAFASGPGR
jgi:phospholipase/carboxylesterase